MVQQFRILVALPRNQVWFLESRLGNSQPPLTIAPKDPTTVPAYIWQSHTH